MATADISIRLNTGGADDFRRASRALKEFADSHELERKLRTHLRDAGRPVVEDLRSAVRGVQVTSKLDGMGRPKRHTALRARVATAVRMSVAFQGIRFNVEGARVDPKYGSALAKYLDGELPGYAEWRHPVFGSDRWEVQHGSPWFFETIRDHADDFERACGEAIDEALREIANR